MVSGKATFICDNGHQWKTRSMLVAEGEGCPHCGMGQRTAEDIIKTIGAGVICLLTHPEKPGFVKIGIELGTWAEVCKKWPWGDWEYHRYRHIEELGLAETLIWQLLGQPLPYKPEPIQLDLKVAEEAFAKTAWRITRRDCLWGKKKREHRKSQSEVSIPLCLAIFWSISILLWFCLGQCPCFMTIDLFFPLACLSFLKNPNNSRWHC